MKKLLALLLLVAAPALAQDLSADKASQSIEKNAMSLGLQFVYDEGVLLNTSLTGINFIGATVTCVANMATQAADCTFTAGGGSSVTGTGLWHSTSGTLDGAAATLSGGLSFNTGVLTSLTMANDSFWTAANQIALSSGNAAAAPLAPTVAGTTLNYDGSTLAFRTYPVNAATESVVFEDFHCGGASSALSTQCGAFTILGHGTSAGVRTVTLNAVDGNHPGVAEMDTGTTTSGGVAVGSYHGHDSGAPDTIVLGTTAVVLESEVYIPVASGGTNTFRFLSGFCDTWASNGDCTDGVAVYWDNNSDVHWGCETSANAVRTETLSTTTATAAAWHKINVAVNAAASSATFTVDGSPLSCSPLTTHIPSGITRGVEVMNSLQATAGCAATTTCLFDIDYMYFRQAVSR